MYIRIAYALISLFDLLFNRYGTDARYKLVKHLHQLKLLYYLHKVKTQRILNFKNDFCYNISGIIRLSDNFN